MAYKKAFVDSDILINLLLRWQPFSTYSKALFNDEITRGLSLNTSALILANVHYILSKNLGRRAATDSIRYIMDMLNVFPFGSDHLASAVETNSSDFEDTIQYHIAARNKCDLIISRNIKHYQKFDLPVLTAGQFLRSIL